MITLLLISLSTVAAAEQITFGYMNTAPYTGVNLDNKGLMSQIVKEAFLFENIKVKFISLPMGRILDKLRKGDIVGTPVLWKRRKRQKYLHYSSKILNTNQSAFYLDSRFQIKSFNDFKRSIRNKTITAPRDYAIMPFLTNSRTTKFVSVTNDIQSLKMILMERADFCIGEEQSMKLAIQKNKTKLKVNSIVIKKEGLFIAISKKAKRSRFYLRVLNNGIKRLRKTGRLKYIVSKHTNGF